MLPVIEENTVGAEMSVKTITLEEGELVYLMHNLPPRTQINLAFGPGWVGLKVTDENDDALELLLLKRGVLNENFQGSGI